MKHRSGWWRCEDGEGTILHWFDNDVQVSVCGTLHFVGMMAAVVVGDEVATCKLCLRMLDQLKVAGQR